MSDDQQALWKTAVHEAGHVVCARYLGIEVGGVTIIPGPGYNGLTWGPDSQRALHGKEGFDDLGEDHVECVAENVSRKLKALAPGPGEDQSEMDSLFIGTRTKLIELMAGEAAERLIFEDQQPELIGGDLSAALAVSGIVSRTLEGQMALAEYGFQEARAILEEQRSVLLAVATALINHPERTLDQSEIDAAIRSAVANEAAEAERERRKRWAEIEANAERFTAHCQ
ncbi:MAG: hypothetical protein R3D82_16040 [Xanthobacteraceae bacterium]